MNKVEDTECWKRRKEDLLEILEYVRGNTEAFRRGKSSISEIKSLLKIGIVSLRSDLEDCKKRNKEQSRFIAEISQRAAFKKFT